MRCDLIKGSAKIRQDNRCVFVRGCVANYLRNVHLKQSSYFRAVSPALILCRTLRLSLSRRLCNFRTIFRTTFVQLLCLVLPCFGALSFIIESDVQIIQTLVASANDERSSATFMIGKVACLLWDRFYSLFKSV